MPRGDGTGPMGQGPKTGRGAGLCVGYDVPGYKNPDVGKRPRLGKLKRKGTLNRKHRHRHRGGQ